MKLSAKLCRLIADLKPCDGVVDGEGQWCLSDSDRNILVYSQSIGKDIELTVPRNSNWHLHCIDAASGEMTSGEDVAATPQIIVRPKTNVVWFERADN